MFFKFGSLPVSVRTGPTQEYTNGSLILKLCSAFARERLRPPSINTYIYLLLFNHIVTAEQKESTCHSFWSAFSSHAIIYFYPTTHVLAMASTLCHAEPLLVLPQVSLSTYQATNLRDMEPRCRRGVWGSSTPLVCWACSNHLDQL